MYMGKFNTIIEQNAIKSMMAFFFLQISCHKWTQGVDWVLDFVYSCVTVL